MPQTWKSAGGISFKLPVLCMLFLLACQREASTDDKRTYSFKSDTGDLKEILAPKDSSLSDSDNSSNDRTSIALWDSAHLERCDIATVLYTDQHIRHLNDRQIFQFLYTFYDSCSRNVEYSEYSNEMLFQVVEYYPASFLHFMVDAKIQSNYVLSELKQPVTDGIDLESVYHAVAQVGKETAIKDSVLKSLKAAINN